ncbi:heterokaryon incompatibility protein [Colletotrichum truncatum]|uniref:Heterokaryon incompatibility protein n=1 Tax=Colletotrichum truncatum TaxID=5467 RepID=A0ACC3YV09_COLTU|nr:heterokaryon incompatibility protein [Colletotrichum truncatum]KAF6785906.1 heterokaryon incompatibility protein [Colletotrichum truncatum]
MTQSVRDAVRVCRSLSIRYLWIDALCIIQDDAADWQRESASMAFIYNNAYCTIVAASTSSCHQSFLERRFDMMTVPFVSRINPESAGHYGLYASGYGAGGAFAWPTLDFDKNCKWLHRGWTYQERKMSRRSIFFGRNMIHFECSSMSVAENQEPDSRRALSRPSALGELIKHQDPNSVYKQWDMIITSLNLKEFTFVHDKLPSVSGIAKLFAGLAGGDRYVAGLWQQDLPFGLLWFSRCAVIPRFNISLRQLTNRLRHPTPYIVPSWSPAYISDTQISRSLLGHRIERQEFRPRCSVIEAQVTVNGENAYGQVQDGVLKVRGRFGRIPSDFFLLSCAHSMVEVRYLVDSGRLVAYCSPDCWSEEEVWPRDEVALLVLGSSDALGSFLAASHSRRDNESWGRWHCNAATYGWYGYKTIVSSPTRDATRLVQEHGVREETDAKAAGAALSNKMEVPNEDDKGKSTWGPSGESDTKEMKSGTQPPPTLEFSKLDMIANGSDDTTRGEAENGVTSDGKDAENATTEQKIDQEDLDEQVIFTNSDSEKPSKHEFSSTITTESYCPTFNYFDRIGNGWYEDNEDAWGLLLAPAAQEGKWIRVGAWWSVVGDGGGTRYFDKFDVQEVDII